MRRPVLAIGHKLRKLRESKGISQRVLEERSGMARTYISRIERGGTIPRVDTLGLWARALGMTVFEMFRQWDDEFISRYDPFFVRLRRR